MKDVSQANCEFGESIVSYMYDEMTGPDRERFETHLLDCTSCTDEFAGVANARYGVYEWNKIEFTAIPTPRFEIPYGEPVALVEKVRRAFAFNWGWAGAAFASIAVVLGFAYFAVTTVNSPDVAGVQVPQPEAVKDVVPPPIVKDPELPTSESGAAETAVVKPVSKAKTQPVQVNLRRSKRDVVPQQTRMATNTRRPPSAPRLNEYAEEVDDSLRLAELFDDVESSE